MTYDQLIAATIAESDNEDHLVEQIFERIEMFRVGRTTKGLLAQFVSEAIMHAKPHQIQRVADTLEGL